MKYMLYALCQNQRSKSYISTKEINHLKAKARVTFNIALKFNGNKEMNPSLKHTYCNPPSIAFTGFLNQLSFIEFSNFLLYGGLS